MNYTYLVINLAVISVPLLATFYPRWGFRKHWRAALGALIIAAVPFLIWDAIFSSRGIWWFNDSYILGKRLFGLPIEEILFFFTIPYACFVIYLALEKVVKLRQLQAKSPMILIACIFAVVAILAQEKTYLLVASSITAVYFWQSASRKDSLIHNNLYLYYLALGLVGFVAVNTVLTALPIVSYNSADITGIRFITIPLEDFIFYLVMNTFYLEVFLELRKRMS